MGFNCVEIDQLYMYLDITAYNEIQSPLIIHSLDEMLFNCINWMYGMGFTWLEIDSTVSIGCMKWDSNVLKLIQMRGVIYMEIGDLY